MSQIQGSPQGGRVQGRAPTTQLTNIALRGVGQVVDLQMTAAKAMLRTQARAAAAFGWPDVSGLFDSGDERTRRLFSVAAEQVANTAQKAGEAAAELRREVGRLIESQTAVVAENWQRSIEELGVQAEQGLSELRETTLRTIEEAEQATREAGEAARESLRQGGEAVRETLREGADATREAVRESGDATRQALREGGDVARQAGREGADLARQAGEAGQQAVREAGDAARQGGGTPRQPKAA